MRPTTGSAFLANVFSAPRSKANKKHNLTIRSTGNPALDAYITEHLTDSFAGASVTVTPKRSSVTAAPKQRTATSASPPDNGADQYCFHHGWNFTHVGTECFALQAKPDTESRKAKMEATNPRTRVDGHYGSTSIAGAPPRTGKGNPSARRSSGGGKKRGQAAAVEAYDDESD